MTSNAQKHLPCLHTHAPYAMYGKEPEVVENDEEIHSLLDDANMAKDDKMNAFLNDPEKVVKVFLSLYMQKQGLIWCVYPFSYTCPRVYSLLTTWM
jgi:hypothetical protein